MPNMATISRSPRNSQAAEAFLVFGRNTFNVTFHQRQAQEDEHGEGENEKERLDVGRFTAGDEADGAHREEEHRQGTRPALSARNSRWGAEKTRRAPPQNSRRDRRRRPTQGEHDGNETKPVDRARVAAPAGRFFGVVLAVGVETERSFQVHRRRRRRYKT